MKITNIFNYKKVFLALCDRNFFNFLSDSMYLKLKYYCKIGRKLNLNNPKTYNEKLQWLKLYDRNPLYTKLVDKYEVKQYVIERIGDSHVAKTLDIWDSPQEVALQGLPQRFVLKTTHGGGNSGVIICKDKTSIDEEKLRHALALSMGQDLYRDSREWPYKDVKRRIIAEEYLEDKETGELRDYKFFCFNGEVKALFVATERQTRKEPFFNFFDREFNSLELRQGHPCAPVPPAKPALFEEMVRIAEKLSANMPHVRVDLYQANSQVYFGEFTFYHFGGMVHFEPEVWDKRFGEWLILPKN